MSACLFKIGNSEIEIDTELDESYVQKLEKYINSVYSEIKLNLDCSHDQAIMLTLLQITDELWEEKKKNEKLKNYLFNKASRLM